ncbi:hypothetical protein HH1059_08970 [Halorhodospira halochloris]|uniref:Voltage-dependent anion channel n=2 Tax=Halorhodospira halochloris TaxID=1052 RepID=A0A0X8X8N0_HALHR|nr:hypothetical protein [Halorhodospira halochloris]BAU57591.2 hypothetical protein HH1059_08970 [Halorhodospira halochloris]
MGYRLPTNMGSQYSPLYFLAALGAGGLTVSFFMWLMFWVPSSQAPVPLFDDIVTTFLEGGAGFKFAIGLAWLGIIYFAYLHIRLLVWNLREYSGFKASEGYRQMRGTRTEIQLLAGPLTLAMTINVGFILGMVFMPGLWEVVEWLFPLAMLAFLAVGAWALRLLGDFWGRVLTESDCDCAADNSLAQMLPAFALAMIGVGLAAPAAMSDTTGTVVVSLFLSSFFMVTAIISGAIMLVLGVRSMLEQTANPISAPSLWIVIPILTIIGITLVRQTHGVEFHLGGEGAGVETLGMLMYFLVIQIAFLLIGWVVLRRYGYFGRFVLGKERSAGSYTLVCPGVALSVMLHFFTNEGLVLHGVIDKFGPVYWSLTGLAILVQFATIALVFRLNKLHFK